MMKAQDGVFQTTVPRETVEVLLPDGRILCGPRNRPIASFLKSVAGMELAATPSWAR